MRGPVLPIDEPWPGPPWDSQVHFNKYPLVFHPGDVYVNYTYGKNGPLYYLLTRENPQGNLVKREELWWITDEALEPKIQTEHGSISIHGQDPRRKLYPNSLQRPRQD
jgi:hypothetical protein